MFRWTLTYQSTTVVADRDPVGWEGFNIDFIRSEKYFGIFKEISEELGFFCNAGGGQLLKDAFANEGFEANVEILVEYQCSDGDAWDTVIDGRASMDSYKIERLNEAEIAYVKIENNDLSYKIMSRDSLQIDIKSLTGVDGQALTPYTYDSNNVTLARNLQISSSLQNNELAPYSALPSSNSPAGVSSGLFIPATKALSTDLQTINDTDTQFLFAYSSGSLETFVANYGSSYYPVFEVTETDVQTWPSPLTINFTVSGTLTDPNMTATQGFFHSFALYAGFSFLSAVRSGALYVQPILTFLDGTTSKSFSFTQTITLLTAQAGVKIWAGIFSPTWFDSNSGTVGDFISNLLAGISVPILTTGTLAQNITYDISQWDFSFTSSNRFPASEIETCLIHEAFSRISESISGQNTAFYSNLLGRLNSQPYSYNSNGCHSFIGVTNGLGVRGLNEPITTSFSEMYDTVDAIGNIGIGVEAEPNGLNYSVVRLEEKSYFFNPNSLLITLQGITEVEKTVLDTEIFNEVEIGYLNWQPFAVTGLDEPLTKQTYTNIVKNIKNKLQLLSPAILSMNLIEIIRRFSTDKNITEDLQQDETLVYIALNRDVDASNNPNNLTTPEYDENFSAISNLTESTTALNLRYSPKRNLTRHLNRLAASLTRLSSLFRYASGEGNQDMTTTMVADGCAGDYSGQLLTEDAAIRWDDSNVRNNTPLFEPILYTFTHPISLTEYNQIKANTKGYIRGVCADGNVIEGFVKQVGYKVEQGMADFVLIKKY